MTERLLMLGFTILATLSCDARATEPTDWTKAERGVVIGGRLAFSGCLPATAVNEQNRRAAVLKAMANLARTRKIEVGGEEKMSVGDGNSGYSRTISEEASSFVNPVQIIDEQLVLIEGTQSLCVLVQEQPRKE